MFMFVFVCMPWSFCLVYIQPFSRIQVFICLVDFITLTLFNFLTCLIEIHVSLLIRLLVLYILCVCVCVLARWGWILVKMYFHPESGKWWTGSHRQCPLPLPPVFLQLHLSFRYRSTLSLSPALSIPKSLFFLDCLSLINLMLNLETYFSKSLGLER